MKSTHPFCQCLYEIENGLPRSKFCFVACSDQFDIIELREEMAIQEKINKRDEKIDVIINETESKKKD